MPKTLISRSIFMARSATVNIPGFLYLVIFIGHCMDTCWGTSQRRDSKRESQAAPPYGMASKTTAGWAVGLPRDRDFLCAQHGLPRRCHIPSSPIGLSIAVSW